MTFVMGYGDSPGSQRALDVALELAARFDEPLVLVYGVTPPGVSGEEFRAHQGQRMVSGELAAAVEVVHQGEARLDPLGHRDGHGPVQLDHGRGVYASQHRVEGGDLSPVGGGGGGRLGVYRRDRRLQRVRSG